MQPGVRMASRDNFTITVEGSSTHGSTPHLGTDGIVVAASIIMVHSNHRLRRRSAQCVGCHHREGIHGGQRFNILANKV